jgi:hypothetical protein
VSKRVFISYRREDSGFVAGRVYDRLCLVLGKSNVFFDRNAIRGGEDFHGRIVAEIDRSDAVLVLIGRNWLGNGNQARIWDPNDYVSIELKAALTRPILVLPLRIDGTEMVRRDQLPPEVSALASKHALPLRQDSFDDDMENVITTVLGRSAKPRVWDDRNTVVAKIIHSLVGLATGLIILGVIALVHFWILARPLSASIGSAATTLLLLLGGGLGAVTGYVYEARKR